MLVTPALPWPTGDTGGTIKLSRRISEDELLAGAVKFTFDNDGRVSVGNVVRDQYNQLVIRVDNDIFIVSPFPYGSDTLTLTRFAGQAAQAYSLINVELLHELTVINWTDTGKYVAVEPGNGKFVGKYIIGEILKTEKIGGSIDLCSTGENPNKAILCDAYGKLSTEQIDSSLINYVNQGYAYCAKYSGLPHSTSAIEAAGGVQGIVLP